jgi:carbonic anhydrase/acetyltransferase-like protein (isoleucine patch superfamily)
VPPTPKVAVVTPKPPKITHPNPKYEFTGKHIMQGKVRLWQIRPSDSTPRFKKHGIGGYIQYERNLSHEGNCWVESGASVRGKAKVYGDAEIQGRAQVYGDASIYDHAVVDDNAKVFGRAKVYGGGSVSGRSEVYGFAQVSGSALVSASSEVFGYAHISGNADVIGSLVYGNVHLEGQSTVYTADLGTQRDVLQFIGVGSNQGTLCAYRTASGKVSLTRGCFEGSIDQFKSEVKNTHDDSKYGQSYMMLVEMISHWFNAVHPVTKPKKVRRRKSP